VFQLLYVWFGHFFSFPLFVVLLPKCS
jgi:hypothetical protein